MLALIIISSLVLLLVVFLASRIRLFSPQPGIFYFLSEFNDPVESIHNVGIDGDNGGLRILLRDIYDVKQFDFEFKKIMIKEDAEARGFKSFFDIPDDPKNIVVSRKEKIDGYLAKEFHPIVVQFKAAGHGGTKKKDGEDVAIDISSVDTYILLEAVYEPFNAILMRKSCSNWLTVAETTIADIFSAVGRTTNFETIRRMSLNDFVHESAIKGDTAEEIIDHLNVHFKEFGFRILALKIRNIGYGAESRDIFQDEENLKAKEIEQASKAIDNQIKIANAKTDMAVKNFDTLAYEKRKKVDVIQNKEFINGIADSVERMESARFSKTPSLTHLMEADSSQRNSLLTSLVQVDWFKEGGKKPENTQKVSGNNQNSGNNKKKEKQNQQNSGGNKNQPGSSNNKQADDTAVDDGTEEDSN